MSNKVKLYRNGEIKSGGLYRLIPLNEAVQRWPRQYQPLTTEADKAFLKELHVGSKIKLLVEANVSPTQKAQEEIWVNILALRVNKSPMPHIGEVATVAARKDYHGLLYRDVLRFNDASIVDVWLNAIPNHS